MKITYIKHFFLSLCVASISIIVPLATPASAQEGEALKQVRWPFEGVLGSFDRQAIQRGFQVYKEVCSTCHSLKLVSYRQLADVGFSLAEIKAIAAEKKVQDGPNDAGEMFERPATAADHFVSPYLNENAARAANNGSYPPDLSLIIKARHHGPNYIYSLLTGFKDAPEDVHMNTGMYYNLYFPGKQIAMPPPLNEGAVTYADNTSATVDQMAKDVVQFLQWASEPEMESRKRIGIKVLTYLSIFTALFYVAKKRIWTKLAKK